MFDYKTRIAFAVAIGSALCCVALGMTGCGGKKGEEESSSSSEYLPADSGDGAGSKIASNEGSSDDLAGGTKTFDTFDPNELESQFDSPILPSTTASPSSAGSSELTSGTGEPVAKPPSLSQDALNEDQFRVPVGNPNETMAFIQRMQAMLGEVRTAEDEIKIQRALADAADVMFQPESDLQTRMGAIRLKGSSLQKLAVLGDETAKDDLDEYCDVLVKNRNRGIAALGYLYRFASTTAGYFAGEDGMTFEMMRDEYTRLVNDYNDQFAVFEMSVQMVQALDQMEQDEEAKAMLAIAAEAFQKSQNQEMQTQAIAMRDQLKLMQLNYAELRAQVQDRETGKGIELLEATRAALSGGSVSRMIFGEVMHSGKIFELVENYEAATRVYDMLDSTLATKADPELQRVGDMMVANGRTRVGLIGTRAEISGLLEDGRAFDWELFRQGKTVLVVFWSTRWPDSLAHFNEYDRLLKAYSSQGFAVVGINMDQFPQEYAQFQSQFRLPWPNIVSANGEQRGVYGPMGQKYGADSPPFNFVVDPNGVIVDMHLYDSDLDIALARMFRGDKKNSDNPGSDNQDAENQGEALNGPESGQGNGG